MQAQLRADHHLVASQVLEIIGGAAYEAPETAQEPEDSQEDWLAEEGDDSVFYSDEDLGHKATGGGTDEDDGAGAWIREGPEVEEEDRTEPQRPNSEQMDESAAAADPGSAPEEDTKMEARVQNAASGTADPLEDVKAALEAPNLQEALAGFHLRPGAGCTTLPSPKTSFNHLTSSRYDTVSYRRIRRGNTRQKIQKFEHMMVHL